jgi:hypothetical protein
MAHQVKRRVTYQQHWDILLKCGVAIFARLLEINVDAKGHICPLINSSCRQHTRQLELKKYSHYFGIYSPIQLMEHVGPEFQKSPTTHPIRTYDPKVIWLMLCTGGGHMYSGHKDLTWMQEDKLRSTNLFFQ